MAKATRLAIDCIAGAEIEASLNPRLPMAVASRFTATSVALPPAGRGALEEPDMSLNAASEIPAADPVRWTWPESLSKKATPGQPKISATCPGMPWANAVAALPCIRLQLRAYIERMYALPCIRLQLRAYIRSISLCRWVASRARFFSLVDSSLTTNDVMRKVPHATQFCGSSMPSAGTGGMK